MKLQGLSVIFCLIAVPVILILSYYIQAQVDTIALQASYDTKLLDATHDAMVALEINTANEDLSTVSDALRSIVTASTNTFINSLSTNLGMSNASKSALQPYIPAILVTLYDGYYIYSPTKTPVICTSSDGQAVYVGDPGVDLVSVDVQGSDGYMYKTYSYEEPVEGATAVTIDPGEVGLVGTDYGMLLYKADDGTGNDNLYMTAIVETDSDHVDDLHTSFKTDYVLKSYIPYAARYIVKESPGSINNYIDVEINYTLDNFLTVYGKINDIYYTKSGYYTNARVTKVNGDTNSVLLNYSETEIEEYCMNNNMTIEVDLGDGSDVITINSTDSPTAKSAVAYYMRSHIFSEWLRNNLGNAISSNTLYLKESNINESLSEKNIESYGKTLLGGIDTLVVDNPTIVSFTGKDGIIFDSSEDPEDTDSVFSLHKRDVMKNSIQYNLNLAMSLYNEMSLNSIAFNMPVVDEVTWDQITSRISFLSFMQGFRCGLKIYNNYAVVSSTNNEFSVIPEEIYYRGLTTVETIQLDINGDGVLDSYNVPQYHRIDCPIYLEELKNSGIGNVERNLNSFISKEIKYDKIYDRLNATYSYDHMYYACYDCIVSANYITNRNIDGTDKPGYYQEFDYNSLNDEGKKAYVIALGKERQDLYKTNQIVNTQGTETENSSVVVGKNANIPINTSELRKINTIKSVEITIANVGGKDPTTSEELTYPVPVLYMQAKVNGRNDYVVNNVIEGVTDNMFRVVANQKTEQTIVLDFTNTPILLTSDENLISIQLTAYNDTEGTEADETLVYTVKSIKINYK